MEYDFASKEYITIYKANNKIIIGTLVIFNEQRSAYYWLSKYKFISADLSLQARAKAVKIKVNIICVARTWGSIQAMYNTD
jgi:hypothetical protein